MYFINYGIVSYYVISRNYALITQNYTFFRKRNKRVITRNASA